MKEWCPPPSMAQFTPQPVARPLLYPEAGLLVTGKPRFSGEMARYWVMEEMQHLHQVTSSGQVQLGDKVAASHLPRRYLISMEVVWAQTGDHHGYQCPCGTHLTTNKE